MYLRFVSTAIDPDSQCELGLFQASDLLADESLDEIYREYLDELFDWFKRSMPVPGRLYRAWHSRSDARTAICWYKADADCLVGRMWELVAIYREYGLPIKLITTDRPGYVTYEDEHQIAAVPCSETFSRVCPHRSWR